LHLFIYIFIYFGAEHVRNTGKNYGNEEQDAQLSQRDRAAKCVRFGQKWKTGSGRQYLKVYLQPLWHNRPAKLSNLVKKRKIRASTPFKVIQGHRSRYQSKARMRLPISD